MTSRGIPATLTQNPRAKRVPSVDSVRSAKLATSEIAKPSRHQTPRPQARNGNTVFDPKAFLERAGLGKKIVNLRKDETAFAQGDPADTIFYVQKGRVRVTVTSAHGKEATITLVGAGEFLGEGCMVSAHPLRLATATAMTECSLLRISKAEMIRVLREEPELSEIVRLFSPRTERSHPGGSS